MKSDIIDSNSVLRKLVDKWWDLASDFRRDGKVLVPSIITAMADELEAALTAQSQAMLEKVTGEIVLDATDANAVDENGCHTLPNGNCISTGPCLHTPSSRVDGIITGQDVYEACGGGEHGPWDKENEDVHSFYNGAAETLNSRIAAATHEDGRVVTKADFYETVGHTLEQRVEEFNRRLASRVAVTPDTSAVVWVDAETRNMLLDHASDLADRYGDLYVAKLDALQARLRVVGEPTDQFILEN